MSSSNLHTRRRFGTDQTAKDAGFSNFKAFLPSYGLRPDNLADVEGSKAVLRSMGYAIA
jgi:hypothetical protein